MLSTHLALLATTCPPKRSGLTKDSAGPAALLTLPPFTTTAARANLSAVSQKNLTVGGKRAVYLRLKDCVVYGGGYLGSEWPCDEIIVIAKLSKQATTMQPPPTVTEKTPPSDPSAFPR